ncbi:hypothetical protein BUALT_Bualt03G0208800 [Buddleja alternifolia]|uniref:Homeobox domain-containing protein n=1 Tax=Buddleja alternifolia TaxID=168488 RepID=A0AAV6XVH1_9LAMI|nr:hypothetical protein BUALT_Bualt03G0208800 [Buddleja alternifolia]
MPQGKMIPKQLLDMNSSEGDEMQQIGDEDIDNTSQSENGDLAPMENRQLKRKHYHRHTPSQIQEMEAFFKECPHPDAKQRKDLSIELGMEPLQVKFWFQNKRTQMKTKHDRHENTHLRTENEKLRAENMWYREALSNARCPACGGMASIGDMSSDERQLRMENARLREEIDQISAVAVNYIGKPFTNSAATPSSSAPRDK